MIVTDMKFTIKQFNEKFPTSDACLDYLWQIHFADKPCEKCGLLEGFHKLPKRPAYQCECGNQIYPLAGTPFHKSTTDLRTWFLAIFFMTNTRSGMSALQFQRISGVTYKTAWRIFKQVRLMMADDETLLNYDVEVDEAYMHPNPQKRSTAKPHNSQVMFGMVERDGRARIKHVKSSGVRVLVPEIQKNVGKTATIYTDEHGSYRLLKRRGYQHETINHSKQEYVVGRYIPKMSKTSGANSSVVFMASTVTATQNICNTMPTNTPLDTLIARMLHRCLNLC
jgi:hypothetical protein